MKKATKTTLDTLKDATKILSCPKSCLTNICTLSKVVYVLVFLMLGVMFHRAYPFPYFYSFAGAFLFIGCACLGAEYHYCKEIEDIIHATRKHANIKSASYFMNTIGNESVIFIVAPIIIVLVFGVGGCMMFGTIRLTPTLVWVLSLFATVVYISIVGYMQYIFLAVYIFKLSHEKTPYKKLEKKAVEYIPADIAWIKQLTKLTHLYRGVFFTLGCAYIFAFAAFCYLPEFSADVSSFCFFLLWGIIFFAIVLTFPAVSVLEYQWIKRIVMQLKESFVIDLKKEYDLYCKTDASVLTRFVQSICARQILDSKEYPLPSIWTASYATILSIVNLMASITTIMGGVRLS